MPRGVPDTVRTVRLPLPGSLAAADAGRLLDGEAAGVALVGRWCGVRAIVARDAAEDGSREPFAALDRAPVVEGGDPVAVGGGWFGHLGYPLLHRIERIPPAPRGPLPGAPVPDAALAFCDHVAVLDDDGRWWAEALVRPGDEATAARWADEWAARLRALEAEDGTVESDAAARTSGTDAPRGAGDAAAADGASVPGAAAAGGLVPGPWELHPGVNAHAEAVAEARERIRAGDLFQANLATTLRAPCDADPAAVLAAGVRALDPDRAALVVGPWGAVVSLSPELFLERRGRAVRTAPIKGTRARATDPEADAAARAGLAASEKDRAENVMIVDLMRNDLGRVCRPGSVDVAALCDVRPHAGVWHMVSEVRGELAPDRGDGDLLRATFPPGSVTGAPKVAAMQAIHALERSPRAAYTGAIGLASPVAGLELSVAIRTFELAGGRAWLQVGGGIVADSDPAAEAAECLTKAAPLLRAVGGTVTGDPAPALP